MLPCPLAYDSNSIHLLLGLPFGDRFWIFLDCIPARAVPAILLYRHFSLPQNHGFVAFIPSPQLWAQPCTFATSHSPFLLEPGPIQRSLTWSHGGSFWDTHQFSGLLTFNTKLGIGGKSSASTPTFHFFCLLECTLLVILYCTERAVAISIHCSHGTESPGPSSTCPKSFQAHQLFFLRAKARTQGGASDAGPRGQFSLFCRAHDKQHGNI